MGCSCSASSAVNLSIERQCSMMFLRLTTQLATDEFGRARDMKKFIFGRKIIVQSVLIDVWILYMGENNQASEMPKNVFKEIFGCYVSAVVKYLSQWVRNMLVLSMKSLNLNLSENDIWDIFNDCKRYIDFEIELKMTQLRDIENLSDCVWKSLEERGALNPDGTTRVDYTVFRLLFIKCAEDSWGKSQILGLILKIRHEAKILRIDSKRTNFQ
eukprot:jgi/Bigna1/132412/aug1.17_g7120